ncbi:Uncharacterised protein [uncultured archaeon]|nr:Uncharacterised protein [uncultured archaeon]
MDEHKPTEEEMVIFISEHEYAINKRQGEMIRDAIIENGQQDLIKEDLTKGITINLTKCLQVNAGLIRYIYTMIKADMK